MNDRELEHRSIREVTRLVTEDGPPEPHVINTDSETEWNSTRLRHINDNTLHILGRSGDIIVFFDSDRKLIGWRDDGRKGTRMPAWVDSGGLLRALIHELDLPKETRLGSLEPAELPPLGWTHQAVLFLAPVPSDEQIIRVWVSPQDLRVIQCLFGPRGTREGGE